MYSLYIFRRDFRIIDNIGFTECMKNNKYIIPIFIFTPEQIKTNSYKSSNAVQFMIQSLENLNNVLDNKLNLLYGNQESIILQLIKKYKINSIYTNTDYTPYSIKRDYQLSKLCNKLQINFKLFHDICLLKPGTVLNKTKQYYQKFTPFYNEHLKHSINKPTKNNNKVNFKKIDIKYSISFNKTKSFYKYNKYISVLGGRNIGLLILKNIIDFKNYKKERNILALNTTRLSAYLKFGCLSIREVYYSFLKNFGKKCDLIKQLIWRDFYYNLGFGYKDRFGKSLKEKYDNIKWINNKTFIDKWKNCKTGYPVVDACMKELNTTGYMHNRGRLIVSGFLIKNLQTNWRIGEKYFATQLVDYDVLVNQGNWQWASGSGADSQPYFRIFNPWLQSKNFDPDCIYIKKWLPELKDIPNKEIHEWDKFYSKYKLYYKPIIDYKLSKEITLNIYKKGIN